jgi:transposase InsO family protein
MLMIILRTFVSALLSRRQLVLENVALRHQLDVLQRTARRPRLRTADRALWVLLCRIFGDWRRHLTIVQPETVIRWHRLGWRLYWRRKCQRRRPDRPLVEAEVRALIHRLSIENPLWGAPRIHGELLKLGYEIAEATVAKYMARRPGSPSQSWRTFVRNHLHEIVAIDFFTVPTATFRTFCVFLVLSVDRRRVVHLNVADSPTAEWTSLQLIQAFPFDTAPRFLIRDRDSIYGDEVVQTLRALGIKQKLIAYQSPWHSGHVERAVGSLRRECLDHVIVLGERHLRRVLREYVAYYHDSRTHLGLDNDAPQPRRAQRRDESSVVSQPVLGGLHHRYWRHAA